ncbi:MAG: Rnase Y domain-containing protein, partial [Agathobaculum butyriciproducens]
MSNIIIPIITGIVCLAVGVIIGFLYRKSVAEKEIGSAETEATRIINEAIKAGETKKRESILEAKDEIHKQRVEADRELKERRNETQQLERRLIQREEALDKKSDMLDRKNDDLNRQLDASQKEKEELERIKLEQVEKLEQIASMTRDEARDMLVQSIENEATHDAAVKLREINQRLKDESEQTAREIISTAIQRCAAD